MSFAEKVHAARIALNLSQRELSQRSGVSVKSLVNYERGAITEPNTAIVRKLAKALEVSISYLLDEEEIDTQKDIDQDLFLAEVRERFGSRAVPGAMDLLASGRALHAGGDISDAALESFQQAMLTVFMDIKEEARARYSPKKRKRPSQT